MGIMIAAAPCPARRTGVAAFNSIFGRQVMRKLMIALVAGVMSAAVAGAYAAQGSPADTDKAGRAGPGTAAGQMGASDPTPGKAGGTTGGMNRSGAGASSSTGAGAGGGSMGAGASSSTTTSGSSATSDTGGDTGKARRSRRGARASRG